MILVKTIKPARLKDGVFRLEMLNALRKAGTQVKGDFEKTTATWSKKPEFEMLISLTGPGPVLLVGTDDEIYGYVSKGTRPHPIRPRRAKRLRFQSGYKAKTQPGVIGSTMGGSFGPTVFSLGVMHPGTAARKFEETIRKKREKWFKRQMEAAMSRAAAKSGNGL